MTPVAVVVHRGDAVVYANPAAASLANRPRESDLSGLPMSELFGPDAPHFSGIAAWRAVGAPGRALLGTRAGRALKPAIHLLNSAARSVTHDF